MDWLLHEAEFVGLFHENTNKCNKSEVWNFSSSICFLKQIMIYMHSTGTHDTDANVCIFPDGKTEGAEGREWFAQLQRRVDSSGRVRFIPSAGLSQLPRSIRQCLFLCLGSEIEK